MDEIWKLCRAAPDYEVSNFGRVRRATVGKGTFVGRVRAQHVGRRHGYPLINLSVNGGYATFKVHRLVCEAFHGPPPFPGADVAHADGDRQNSAATNLRWATRAENMEDAISHGTVFRARGSSNTNSKLTEADVLAIRAAPRRRGLLYELATKYGVSRNVIGNIRTKGSPCWNHIR